MKDRFNLQRFVDAQHSEFDEVRSELKAGQKTSHWMWFIFPQIVGLGYSEMSKLYAISSLEEAAAYLSHPVLGQRLRECTALVNSVNGRSAAEIFGHLDAMKFKSSMTLFAHATKDNQIFNDAIKKYFGGKFDPLTVDHVR